MSRKRKERNKGIKIVIGIIAILLILALIVFFGLFTKGFTQPVATFYLRYDGELLLGECEKVFPRDEVKIEVKYLLEFAENDTDYTVSITPNPEKDFTYQMGEENYKYSETGELTELFTIDQQAGYFTIDFSSVAGMQELLSEKRGEAVTTEEKISLTDSYFILTVTASNGDEVIIKFGLERPGLGKIEVNPSEVIF